MATNNTNQPTCFEVTIATGDMYLGEYKADNDAFYSLVDEHSPGIYSVEAEQCGEYAFISDTQFTVWVESGSKEEAEEKAIFEYKKRYSHPEVELSCWVADIDTVAVDRTSDYMEVAA